MEGIEQSMEDHNIEESSEFFVLLEKLLARQETLLRTLHYIERRQAEMDDVKKHILSRVTERFSDVDPKTLSLIVDARLSNKVEKAFIDLLDQTVLNPESHENGRVMAALFAVSDINEDPPSPVVYSSLLTSLVGSFELFVAGLASHTFSTRPDTAINKAATFTWEEINQHTSIEALRESRIDRYVLDIMRGSYDDWIDLFKARFGVTVPESVRPFQVREIFQRRNVIVHNDGIANALYIEKMPELSGSITEGTPLPVDPQYLRDAADRLASLAWHLVWAFGSSWLKDDERHAFEHDLCLVPYRHLESRRYQAVLMLDCTAALKSVQDEDHRLMLRVNYWLAQKRMGMLAEIAPEIESWQTNHLSNMYKLARLALLNQLDEGLELVKQLRASRELLPLQWHSWPLLEELRTYEASTLPQKQIDP